MYSYLRALVLNKASMTEEFEKDEFMLDEPEAEEADAAEDAEEEEEEEEAADEVI
jgi:hypothetical protein